jgi:hypothetical protein
VAGEKQDVWKAFLSKIVCKSVSFISVNNTDVRLSQNTVEFTEEIFDIKFIDLSNISRVSSFHSQI